MTFGRYFYSYDNKKSFEASRWCENLRALSCSLKHGWDNSYGTRYLTMEMPSYSAVLHKVEMAVSKFLAMEKNLTPTEALSWEAQSLVVVAAQTMLPPLRGRPYWDLELEDNALNSMLCQPIKLDATIYILTDYVHFGQSKAKLIIRRQKTSKVTGLVEVDIPVDLTSMFLLWVQKYRTYVVQTFGISSKSMFLNPKSQKPFDTRTFSKYCKASFQNVTDFTLNLQMMRTIFASGVLTRLLHF